VIGDWLIGNSPLLRIILHQSLYIDFAYERKIGTAFGVNAALWTRTLPRNKASLSACAGIEEDYGT